MSTPENDYRDSWVPYTPNYGESQNTILEAVFHSGLMLGRESVWAGLDYDEATALNPYTGESDE